MIHSVEQVELMLKIYLEESLEISSVVVAEDVNNNQMVQ